MKSISEWNDQRFNSRLDAERDVLVVDDDECVRTTLALFCRNWGFTVRTAATGKEAIRLTCGTPPDLAVVDLRLPDTSGLELATELKAQTQRLATILITGFGTMRLAWDAGRRGVDVVLEKPFFEDDFAAAVRSALVCDLPCQFATPGPTRITSSVALSWARLIVSVVRHSKDLHSIGDWSTLTGIPRGTIERRCEAVGVPPKASLDFARVLRAVYLSFPNNCVPELLLNADPRTVRRLERLGLPSERQSVSSFLAAQRLVTNRLLQQSIVELLDPLRDR